MLLHHSDVSVNTQVDAFSVILTPFGVSLGLSYQLFDKGRMPGGRTAAKRVSDGRFADHGAPKLEIADARLAPYLSAWRELGVLSDWMPGGADQSWQVAQPTTRGLAQYLGEQLDVRQGTAVTELQRDRGSWLLVSDEATHGPFDRVIVTAPAPQAADLIASHAPEMAERARTAAYRPIMSALAVFDRPLDGDADLLLPKGDQALEKAVPERFAGDRYLSKKEDLIQHFTASRADLLEKMETRANTSGFSLSLDAQGALALNPLLEGRTATQEEFEQLPAAKRKRIHKSSSRVLSSLLQTLRRLNRLQEQRLSELEREIRERAPELAGRLGL